MKCYLCDTELIWGGDQDCDDDSMNTDFPVVTNFSCPNCGAVVVLYHPEDGSKREDDG